MKNFPQANQLSAHGYIDDKFFQKFSYEDTAIHEKWRREQLTNICLEYKNKINKKQRHLSQVNSEDRIPL